MNLRNITTHILTNLGVTYSLNSGEVNPESGFMVSLRGHERKFNLPLSVDDIEKHVKDFIMDFSSCLANEDNYFGAWLDSNTLYLDVSIKVNSSVEAYKLAVKNKQLAYFDNFARKTVLVSSGIEATTIEDIEKAILSGSKEVLFKGRVVALPTPQKSGTMTQNRSYVYLKAKEIYYSK